MSHQLTPFSIPVSFLLFEEVNTLLFLLPRYPGICYNEKQNKISPVIKDKQGIRNFIYTCRKLLYRKTESWYSSLTNRYKEEE
jgi:hypothetical protein